MQDLKQKLALAEHNVDVYHSFFDFSSEAIIVHKGGIVADINQTVTDMLGYTREELINKNIIDIIPLKKYVPLVIEQVTNGNSAIYTIEGIHKNGLIIPLELRGITIKGRDGLRITSARDISKQINTEDTLRIRNEELLQSKDVAIAQERKFETLFNISFNAYIMHQQGKIQEVNDMFSELYGYSKEEAKDLDIFASLFPNQQMTKEYQKQASKPKRTYFVGQQVRKDGSIFDAEIIANWEILNGKEVRLVTIKDISKLVESERSLKEKNQELMNRNRELELVSDEVVSSRNTFYQSIQNNQSNISKQDLQKVTVYGRWNYNFLEDYFTWTNEVKAIIGYDADSTDSTIATFIKHVHPEDRDELEASFFEALKSRKLFKSEFRFNTNDGQEKYILAQGVAEYNEDKKIRTLIGTMIDITDRKTIENRLKRQKDNYLKLNEELIISRKKAEDSEKLKTSFFSNMSHVIRTPLNGILSFSSLLMEPELSDEERLEYSQVIVDSGKRLLHIVNDILDISKLQSDNFKIMKSESKINRLLDTLYSLFSQEKKVQEGDLKFTLHKPLDNDECIIYTDHNRLNQIITNLLSNAMKFTEKGHIDFGYRIAGDALNFYVEDSGIGVPEEMTEKIFEPFRQVEGHLVKEHGGTGLGLAISRKLTHLLGGEMTLESEEGKGSKFNFTLPYNRTKTKPIAVAPQISQKALRESIQDICLLIAEDDEINFLFYKSFLGNRLTLLRAKNGKEAIDMVKNNPEIDAVLMDIKMPVMNGIEAIKIIKSFRPKLPIIAQTAYAMPEDKKMVIDAGGDDYISKPINRRHLLEKIKNYCVAK
ncbi:MAG: PAS domain S-box protein [Bacteroidales bacterium]|nr:PAS domain S-box protein [Bacteroidales bacterium]